MNAGLSKIKEWHVFFVFMPLFFLLVCFFWHTAPFIPFIFDDWVYFSEFRPLHPTLEAWNPARVLPEILEPLSGQIAALLIMPFTGDYLEAVRITISGLAAFSLVLLCIALERFLRIVSGSQATALVSVFLFLGMAFCLFKSQEHTLYLFYSWALVIFFYYTLPNIANSILIIGFLIAQYSGCTWLTGHRYRLGFVILFIFLAQFSMTVASCASATMAGVLLMARVVLRPEHGAQKLCAALRRPKMLDLLLVFTLLCFAGAAILDVNGARYAWYGDTSFQAGQALEQLWLLAKTVRKPILLVILFFCFGAACIALSRWRRQSKTMTGSLFLVGVCSVCLIAITIAIICIAGKTFPSYAHRISFAYGIFFYLLLLATICFAFCLTAVPALRILAPLLLCWFFVDATGSTWPYPRPITCEQVQTVEEWLSEARRADAAGAESVIISVPEDFIRQNKDGFFSGCMARVLYRAGITGRILTIHFRPGGKKALNFPPR